ncbi:MAG: class I SAM-dependent methyltransferase [Deinococcota bacterium]
MKKAFSYLWAFDESQDFGWSTDTTIQEYDAMARSNADVERQRLKEIGLAPHHVLMDIGCGTGTLVMEAAKQCKQVIALDASKPMIEHLKKQAQSRELNNIDYVQQGFLSYAHKQDLVDVVVSQHTLHHLPDMWKVQALQGMFDVLKPKGVLFLRDVMFSFDPEDTPEKLEHWIRSVAVEDGEGFPKAFFEQQIREEFYTYTWLFEAMLEKVGFEIQDVFYGNYSAYAKYICKKKVDA